MRRTRRWRKMNQSKQRYQNTCIMHEQAYSSKYKLERLNKFSLQYNMKGDVVFKIHWTVQYFEHNVQISLRRTTRETGRIPLSNLESLPVFYASVLNVPLGLD